MKLTVLLVDDDENDIVLTRAAFRMLEPRFGLQTVTGGLQAIAYLSGSAPFQDRSRFPLPDLILLDLKMPDMDGYAVLEWIRSRPQFARLPVLVLAATCLFPDIHRAYAAGANSFITKPADALQLARELQGALDYWLPAPDSAAGPLPPRANTAPATPTPSPSPTATPADPNAATTQTPPQL